MTSIWHPQKFPAPPSASLCSALHAEIVVLAYFFLSLYLSLSLSVSSSRVAWLTSSLAEEFKPPITQSACEEVNYALNYSCYIQLACKSFKVLLLTNDFRSPFLSLPPPGAKEKAKPVNEVHNIAYIPFCPHQGVLHLVEFKVSLWKNTYFNESSNLKSTTF